MKQALLIIRGGPLSGKSTIGRSLRNFEEKIVWIKVDSFKDFFSEDATGARDYVYGSAAAVARYLLSKGFTVVAEGIFQRPEWIKVLTDVADEAGVPHYIFQLQASEETRIQRMKDRYRDARFEQSLERNLELEREIQENPVEGTIILDTGKNSIDECAAIIMEYIK